MIGRSGKQRLNRKSQSGVAVAVQFAKYHSNLYLGHRQHPITDHALYADKIFPEPKKEVKTEMAAKQKSESGDDGSEEG